MALSSQLLRNVKVQECLREARKKFLKRVTPTYKRMVHEYGKLAYSDIREVLDFETPGGPYLIPGNTSISSRPMLLDRISYVNGWPVVGGAGVPTSTPQQRPTP